MEDSERIRLDEARLRNAMREMRGRRDLGLVLELRAITWDPSRENPGSHIFQTA